MLAAWQGREQEASELIQATVQMATGRGLGVLISFAALRERGAGQRPGPLRRRA